MPVYLALQAGGHLLLADPPAPPASTDALILNAGGFLNCSITINDLPSAGTQQWRLHQFNLKARLEQSS